MNMDSYIEKTILIHPLDSVKPDGILGFRIGDSMEEVFSRIKRLGLMSDIEIKERKDTINEFEKDSDSKIINTGIGMFEEISRIDFVLNRRDVLNLIQVYFRFCLQTTPQQQVVLLTLKLSMYLGQPQNLLQNMYTWRCGNHNINLSYLTDFDMNNVPVLSFDNDQYMQ